jgi:putative PIG3 family NAD(P)H quinone oxidoreductase
MTKARAVWIREPGEPDVLSIREVSTREPGYGEVEVAVAAAGLNRADLLQRKGMYPAPAGVPAEIPGLEYAGEVARVGEGAAGFAPGDRVMGIVGGGAMCTRVVVHARELLRVPAGMSLVEAAAVPEAFMTAYDAMVLQGELGPGDVTLVHAAGSGVGTAALQIARAMGALPLGTVRAEAKRKRLQDMGFDALVVTVDTLADAVRARTDGRGADLCLDGVGGDYVPATLRAMAPRGRVVMIGTLGGLAAELPLALMLRQRLTLRGSVLRARPLEEKADLAQRFSRAMLPLLASGALRPVVDAALPMADIAAAHARMERNDSFGKIVLTWEKE